MEHIGWVLALTGSVGMSVICWFVQLVAYPGLLDVTPEAFRSFHRRHCWGIGIIVVPLMLVELAGSAFLVWVLPSGLSLFGLVLCLFAFGWTFAVSAPLHGRLASGHDASLITRLIRTNLPRTLAWTAHAVVCLLALISPG